MLLVALVLWHLLPPSRNPAQVSYLHVLRSMTVLIAQHPRLRSRSLMGALTFASVSVLFSTMALLLSGPNHGLNDASIGLVGLVGIAGALMASVAGRLADKGWGQATSMACLLLLLCAWGCFWLGSTSLMWFLAGMLIIDLALQGLHINNQNVVFKLDPQARSRLNAVYMTSYFIGAASGSALGTLAWRMGGWQAICIIGVLLTLAAGVVLLHDQKLALANVR